MLRARLNIESTGRRRNGHRDPRLTADTRGCFRIITATESAPPLYYILVWGVDEGSGGGAAGLAPSPRRSAADIPVMDLADADLAAIGLWAAALTTVSPAMYFYSQEPRCLRRCWSVQRGGVLLLASVRWKIPNSRRLCAVGRRCRASRCSRTTHRLRVHARDVHPGKADGPGKRVWAPVGAVGLVGPRAGAAGGQASAPDGKTNWIEELSLPGRSRKREGLTAGSTPCGSPRRGASLLLYAALRRSVYATSTRVERARSAGRGDRRARSARPATVPGDNPHRR